ncbi:MAG: hypothetical protein LBE38_02250 [Deltaproteobacteria bacterium]|jgi:pyrrolysine biosynthesis protein PylD|nr:hypothetical protein [Deltaproteobacteria bacterium]
MDAEFLEQKLSGQKLAVIKITSDDDSNDAFLEILASVGKIMGVDAKVMDQIGDDGFKQAEQWGADIYTFSNDSDFVARNLNADRVIHSNPASSRIFVAALEMLNGGSLKGEQVLVLGLGPVGYFATERLLELGAHPVVYDISQARSISLYKILPEVDILLKDTDLEKTLLHNRDLLIFESVPQKNILSEETMQNIFCQVTPIVSAPGVPLSWPENWLWNETPPRLFHEPLMMGTASMLAGLCNEDYDQRYALSYPLP